MSGAVAPDEWLIRIGDLSVSRHWVATPRGTTPLAGTTFSIVDRTVIVQRTPTWAVVVAILGFFVVFLLSLLFLLVKETATAGHLEVTARNAETGLDHVVVLPVRGGGDVADAYARVASAQQLAAAA